MQPQNIGIGNSTNNIGFHFRVYYVNILRFLALDIALKNTCVKAEFFCIYISTAPILVGLKFVFV